jgi:hypothetical protein
VGAVEQSYSYRSPSAVLAEAGRTELVLSTSGGVSTSGSTKHPSFFDGFIGHPTQAAAALLTCARIARTRFYMPPNMVAAILRAADPVVTSNGDRLRFESFSADAGVYCRFDVLPGGLDVPPLASGTTNVDFNPPMREALAGIADSEPLHLQVGQAGNVVVTTLDASVVERKVPLPERWIRGFAEVQVASAEMSPMLELSGSEARRFFRSLPAETRRPLWVVMSGRSARTSGRPVSGAVCVSGAERLRTLMPLMRFATGLRAYGPSVDHGTEVAPSAWQVDLQDATITVVVSPEVSRGFSGEGAVLVDLADDVAASDAAALRPLLDWQAALTPDRLATAAGLEVGRVRRALVHLGAAGQIGFDLDAMSFFARQLPFDALVLEQAHPRLREARALVAEDAVRTRTDGSAVVTSGQVEYRVVLSPEADRCTCPWWGRHRGSRGPCKHVLAAHLAGVS